MKNEKPLFFRDFSRGTVRTVQNSVCPVNAFKLALNFDSDKELGSLVSRQGTGIIGTQALASAVCYGVHYHRDTTAANHKLFGVFPDGSNNVIYDMSDGSVSLTGDTQNLKTRFCTYLNSTVRVNGTDAAQSFNGSAWVSSGGAFDEANMPIGSVVIEWKDRVYTAGVSSSPCILYYSSVADPSARTVSWSTGNGDIEIEQEDGGGSITALEKVPGYLLIFKERSMKRWDGNSTYPEDLVGVGVPTQEAVCRGRGLVFFANQEGVWATNGSYPKRISKPVQDLWDAIPAANIDDIATVCDENYVYVYVGDITLDGNSFSNIMFRYSIDSQTWDIWSYYNDFTCFTWYISSSSKVIVGGDKNGQILQLNTGNTDYHSTVQPITYSLETQDIDFGLPGKLKELDTINVFSRNIRNGKVFYRANSTADSDWKSIRNITSDVENINEFKAKGNWFNFKITGITSSGQVKLLGFEIPEKAINIMENAN